jgi:hypothetical protein
VTDIVAQNTEAAIMARRHIKEAVNATLRAFPWPFCTRYAELVVIDGALSDPVNNDWIYAYRAPNSMMMARRITVAGKGRRPDPNSPEVPFRLTTDATGLVLYCNVEATDELPLVLEYSVRINCPSFYGDALFRDALGWRFAAELAGPLARDRQRAEECMAMFRQLTEPQARTVAANESQQERDADADWISNRG